MSDDTEPCSKEHPNPRLGPHERVVLMRLPDYLKWYCANCGLEVVEAGQGVGDE
jgi:hypothetical protein